MILGFCFRLCLKKTETLALAPLCAFPRRLIDEMVLVSKRNRAFPKRSTPSVQVMPIEAIPFNEKRKSSSTFPQSRLAQLWLPHRVLVQTLWKLTGFKFTAQRV